MRDKLKTAYMWMRQHHKKPVEGVKTDLKVVKVKKYDVCHMSRMKYPEITVEIEDGRDWVFTEIDFQNVELEFFSHNHLLVEKRAHQTKISYSYFRGNQ